MTTTLFHVSDIHFGSENRAALAAVEQAIARERPDALVCTGDLTQRAKHREYEAAARWFDSLGLPVLVDPGNHDLPYYNLWERFTDPHRRYRRLRAALGRSFESRDVVLVPLNTTVRAQRRFPWSDGVVTRRALEETLAALKRLEGDPRCVIVTAHHPLLGPENGARNPTIGGDAAFAALAAAGAVAVLSGHVHVPFDEWRERAGQRLRMIGAGTLSTRLRGGVPPSYRVLRCERGGRIECELRVAAGAIPGSDAPPAALAS
ncbi:metallophosphoesterase [Erythrobacter sp. HL-111]|uniref:metallophosphoesterase family protein n=1 Tax=Erythrobacter sp. HL-111 TaxID=1798193 RepID=UPI0006DB1289|nr:metallophosphoesterase [Erythrobacter sp. HL-111]KPP90677.1 MAG: 3',5'-cyclic-nucleotide phosphodiesterase [Erythrobacteraceae bacterium HL-111]SDS77050.1 Calcineurin-like phosphoesterase [Erythrobacter sp. HL-111]